MILVDPRIGSGDLVADLKRRVNCEVVPFTLASGDVCWEGKGPKGSLTIGLERKQIRDMLGSMRSDRYAGLQLKAMSRDFDIVYLLIEGSYGPDAEGMLCCPVRGGWAPLNLATKAQSIRGARRFFTYAELDKHLSSLEVMKNVIVLRSHGRNETIHMIVNRYQWWQKEYEDHRSVEAIKFQENVTFTKITLCRKVAAELPGVGWSRSKSIARHFEKYEEPTVSMVTASRDEWGEIEGIGPKLGDRIYRSLRSKK